ncbi:MAG: 4Fe-4S ferredoxin-type protein [Thermodesulfobacteriota bacterium]|nr:4Fe-4S ferredoxin-type protein [Thermodesulfobacteriota bacterium]
MIQRPFFNLGRRPQLPYPVLSQDALGALKDLPPPDRAVLLYKGPGLAGASPSIKRGDGVRTGQRLLLESGGAAPLVATVTGRVADISSQRGNLGKTYSSIGIDVTPRDEQDGEFFKIHKEGSPEQMLGYLEALPGMPSLSPLLPKAGPVRILIISGMDRDLLITSNQFLLKTETDALAEGIQRLKEMTQPDRIIMAVPPGSVSDAEKTGAEISVVRPFYPNGNPRLIVKDALKKAVPMNKSLEEAGIAFLGVDAVIALQPALVKGEIPIHRVVTVVNKDMGAIHARARVGTPVRKVLEALNIETGHGDRVVIGGPMTGRTLYAEDEPVLFDTEGILVQDRSHILPVSDTHCLNCGECVRVCPARIPVNILIRFLENRLYQDAVDVCDLSYCIECGLCSYVCPARIPIFHYIALGKHEFAQQMAEEAAHA